MTTRHTRLALLTAIATLLSAGCGTDNTSPSLPSDRMQLTAAQVKSLDSTAQVMVQANAGNADIQALVDSTLLVLTAGVEAKRVAITTDLTTAPLYFVGVHRAVTRAAGAWSTWTLVGMDDPSRLENLVEVAGFAQGAGATPPSSVSGSLGGAPGVGTALMLRVATGGAVTQWRAFSGTVSFTSDAPGASCPGFVSNAQITCTLETMHVRFSVSAPNGTGGAGSRAATLATETDVPAMRLTYAR